MTYLPTDQDIASYHEHGYWVTPVLLGAGRIAALRKAIERAYQGDLDGYGAWQFVEPVNTEDPKAVKTALFSWMVSDPIRDLVFDPVITRIAAALMGVERIRVWQDQAIWKPGSRDGSAGAAGNIGFHQDYAYWQDASTTNTLSANIALQDTTIENGALRVFDGSHKCGLFDDADGFFDTDIDTLRDRFARDTGIKNETVIDLKAGQVSFHHSLTVHGSGPNVSDGARMVIAPAYMPDGTFYRDEGQPPCPHSDFLGPDRSHGMPFANDKFPLAYPLASPLD